MKRIPLDVERIDARYTELGMNGAVWVVGLWHAGETPNIVWSLAGIYLDKETALEDAKEYGREDVFVAEIQANRFFGPPIESFPKIEWPNMRYARAEG